MSRELCKFLRPSLSKSFRSPPKVIFAQFYRVIQERAFHESRPRDDTVVAAEQLQARVVKDNYPRIGHNSDVERVSIEKFRTRFDELKKDAHFEVLGRVGNVRAASRKLVFADIWRDGKKLQVQLNFKSIRVNNEDQEEKRKHLAKLLHRGDWISITGSPTRTNSGELSISAIELPKIMAPCLHSMPDTLEDPQTKASRPHVDQLVNRDPNNVLKLRAGIYREIRRLLNDDGFIEVETPMFDVNAGGAIARPFETVATEMPNTPLKLRIAPELNLKRLVVGGNDKIFEMGKCFRNEGVDHTHNPEFSICEFYEVGASLEELISRTESILEKVASFANTLTTSPQEVRYNLRGPYRRLPFIQTIEQAIGRKLPNLSSDNATDEVLALFSKLDITVPAQPNLPRLLDALSTKYIEPACIEPTFIIHHPEAVSPLSKSFVDSESGQSVAARVELFIGGREYINAYEEENSPMEQRRKFQDQLKYQREEHNSRVNESYLEVLEWGMPPTGGWGCGLDRLVMLFAGKKRIADVLPFGTLRNVVAISKIEQENAKKL